MKKRDVGTTHEAAKSLTTFERLCSKPQRIERQVLPIKVMDVQESEEQRGILVDDLTTMPLSRNNPKKVTYIGVSHQELLKR